MTDPVQSSGQSTAIDPKSIKGRLLVVLVATAVVLGLAGLFIPGAREYAGGTAKLFLEVVRIILPIAIGG